MTRLNSLTSSIHPLTSKTWKDMVDLLSQSTENVVDGKVSLLPKSGWLIASPENFSCVLPQKLTSCTLWDAEKALLVRVPSTSELGGDGSSADPIGGAG